MIPPARQPAAATTEGENDAGEPAGPFDEVSAINNELVNMSRCMAKTNLQLELALTEQHRLMGLLAHDLRNPIGVIRTYSEFLLDAYGNDLSPKPREVLGVIQGISDYLNGVVSEILDHAAIEAGKLILNLADVDLRSLIGQTVRINSLMAEKKGISLTAPNAADPIIVAVDPVKIKQVLNNLIGNAIKFTQYDGKVTVALESRPTGICVTIEDNGQGIAAEELGRLFLPFSTTSTRPTGGEISTGLGLAICKRIVEGHGGSITVASTLGKGTAFNIILPRAAD